MHDATHPGRRPAISSWIEGKSSSQLREVRWHGDQSTSPIRPRRGRSAPCSTVQRCFGPKRRLGRASTPAQGPRRSSRTPRHSRNRTYQLADRRTGSLDETQRSRRTASGRRARPQHPQPRPRSQSLPRRPRRAAKCRAGYSRCGTWTWWRLSSTTSVAPSRARGALGCGGGGGVP